MTGAGVEKLLFLFGSLFIAAIIVWVFITWGVRRTLLMTMGRGKRNGITLLIFLLPLILLMGNIGIEWLRGNIGRTETVLSISKNVTLAGVTFPPGSQLEYVQDGNFGRDLIAASSRSPLAFGSLRITGIRLEYPPDESSLRLKLASSQIVDGWQCSQTESVIINHKNGIIELDYCRLTGQTVDGDRWPPGSLVQRTSEGWTIYASIFDMNGENCDGAARVNGSSYTQVIVDYDHNRQHATVVSGDVCSSPPVGK
jgi:hypothetical protein